MKIYHNPRCSKSRQTLELIRAQGIEPKIILYLETPPTKAELKNILKKLGKNVNDILRKCETDYKVHFIPVNPCDEVTLIELLVAYPKVIERPIVVAGSFAVIGRPPEAVSVLF